MPVQITADLIKELRERTGVGMAKCKEALTLSHGDMDKAIEHLRKAGIASAVKKESRDAKEGVIGFAETPQMVAIVEISAETDFVTQNSVFQEFLRNVADQIAHTYPKNIDELNQQKFSKDKALTIDELRAVTVQSVGENIQIRRFVCLPKHANCCFGIYSHSGGKILAAVEMHGASDESSFAREIAMHAAAAHPEYLNPEAVPHDIVEKERDIARSQIQGKPANIVEKILEGKVNAFYDQACLVRQKFVKDDSVTITQLVEKHGKEKGKTLHLASFLRWSVGN